MKHSSPTRKMFSHSHKVVWTSSSLLPKAEQQESGIRGRIEVSLKEKLRGSLARLQEKHKYGRFIDRLLIEHAQQNNLPIISPPLSKKHSYRSCRIVKTEQLETEPAVAAMRQETMGIEDRQSGMGRSLS
jgi:hypothetical protein